MKKLSSSEEEPKIYMTDDLLDRLGENELIGTLPSDEIRLYVDEQEAESKSKFSSLCFFFEGSDEPFRLDGNISTVSFGKQGWMCILDSANYESALELARLVSNTLTGLTHVKARHRDKRLFVMSDNLDVTMRSNYDETCSITVSSDSVVAI
jgi:hypothetical protein